MTIKPADFFNLLKEEGLTFYTGVPDSLLKDFYAYVTDNAFKENNIITANEGNAIGLASGYHLATGKIPVVFMQNSGLGNCINPLTSLSDQSVYSIPKLLIIGWRGEPGKEDEPQHKKKGEITLDLLDILGINYSILPENLEEVSNIIKSAIKTMSNENKPYAIVVKKNTFENYELQNKILTNFELNREEAIKLITTLLEENAVIVSTTGKTSRELFESRVANNVGHQRDFLTVGSMGHSSSIALGIAQQQPNKKIYCLDGDGALLMHMGILATIGASKADNFKHIIINNYAHDSVGGQPTSIKNVNIPEVAKSCDYEEVFTAKTLNEIKQIFPIFKNAKGPALLEIKCNKGARKNLGRPTKTPKENKENFMKFLGVNNAERIF